MDPFGLLRRRSSSLFARCIFSFEKGLYVDNVTEVPNSSQFCLYVGLLSLILIHIIKTVISLTTLSNDTKHPNFLHTEGCRSWDPFELKWYLAYHSWYDHYRLIQIRYTKTPDKSNKTNKTTKTLFSGV